MNDELNTHNLECDFGRHKGKRWTRIPVSYLLWMVNVNHSRVDIAEAELKRRGTVLPELDVSGHAIDMASLRLYDIYKERGRREEGLHAWLVRMSSSALKLGKPLSRDDETCSYSYMGVKFVFEESGAWPVLKTVMKDKENPALA